MQDKKMLRWAQSGSPHQLTIISEGWVRSLVNDAITIIAIIVLAWALKALQFEGSTTLGVVITMGAVMTIALIMKLFDTSTIVCRPEDVGTVIDAWLNHQKDKTDD